MLSGLADPQQEIGYLCQSLRWWPILKLIAILGLRPVNNMSKAADIVEKFGLAET
jgi:hypothetical protein